METGAGVHTWQQCTKLTEISQQYALVPKTQFKMEVLMRQEASSWV
jgi:hypothetical protein